MVGKPIAKPNVRAFRTAEILRDTVVPKDAQILSMPSSVFISGSGANSLTDITNSMISNSLIAGDFVGAGTGNLTEVMADQFIDTAGLAIETPQASSNPFKLFQDVARELIKEQDPLNWTEDLARVARHFFPPTAQVAYQMVDGIFKCFQSDSRASPKLDKSLKLSTDKDDKNGLDGITIRMGRWFGRRFQRNTPKKTEIKSDSDGEGTTFSHPLIIMSTTTLPEGRAYILLDVFKPFGSGADTIVLGNSRDQVSMDSTGHRIQAFFEDNIIDIPNFWVTERHAVIGYDHQVQSFYIESLVKRKSGYATYINGKELRVGAKRTLKGGEEILLGRDGQGVVFEFFPPETKSVRQSEIDRSGGLIYTRERTHLVDFLFDLDEAWEDPEPAIMFTHRDLVKTYDVGAGLTTKIDDELSTHEEPTVMRDDSFQGPVEKPKRLLARALESPSQVIRGKGGKDFDAIDRIEVPRRLRTLLAPFIRMIQGKEIGRYIGEGELDAVQGVANELCCQDDSPRLKAEGDTDLLAYDEYRSDDMNGVHVSGSESESWLEGVEATRQQDGNFFYTNKAWDNKDEFDFSREYGDFTFSVFPERVLELWNALKKIVDKCDKKGMPVLLMMADRLKGLMHSNAVQLGVTSEGFGFAYKKVSKLVQSHPEWFRSLIPLTAFKVLDKKGRPIRGLGFGRNFLSEKWDRKVLGEKTVDMVSDGHWVHDYTYEWEMRSRRREIDEGRFYLAVVPKYGEDVWNAMEEILIEANAMNLPMGHKISDNSLYRNDFGVAYLTPEVQEFLYHRIIKLSKSNPEWFKSEIPIFSAQVLDNDGNPVRGVAFGQGYSEFESFGMARARAITDAVARVRGEINDGQKVTFKRLVQWMTQCLRDLHVDVRHPAFNTSLYRGQKPGRGRFKFIFERTDQGTGLYDPYEGPTNVLSLEKEFE